MLKTAIFTFDGRDTDALRVAAEGATSADAPDLMGWANETGRVAEAATWIIKAMVETGRTEGFDEGVLIAIGTRATDWPVALHLLQLSQHWPAMADLSFGQTHSHHAKPMVRTWALDTYVRACLAGQGPLSDARAEVDRVLATGKASEKARARALLAVLNRSGAEPI